MASATPHREATASADNGWNLPTDAFVEILLRLPPIKRWRLRLVCRHWRDVIRDRTPAPAPPTALAFAIDADDPEGGRRVRVVWRSRNPRPARYFDQTYYRNCYVYEKTFDTCMVGTRNGVLCLCDNTTPGGAISLANPAAGETLKLPPLPGSGHWQTWGTTIRSWHEAYAFAHDADTGRYWVAHMPCFFDRNGGLVADALQVLTLGGGSPPVPWREVPVDRTAATCRLDAGLVTIGGSLHWITESTERVVSFDLGAGRVTWTLLLPAPAAHRCSNRWCLTEVHGRLGVVDYSAKYWSESPEITHVWVLESGGGGRDGSRQVWTRRYSVEVDGVVQRLAAPQFAFGEHVVTTEATSRSKYARWGGVFAHRMPTTGMLRMSYKEPGVRVSGISKGDTDDYVHIQGVFAYVENKEALKRFRIHKLGNRRKKN